MKPLKLIGYWMSDLRDTQLPLPQELIGELSSSVRDAVCAYLKRGELFKTYRGLSWCRFQCGIDDREMGCREFTDGEWVWTEGLVHYVQNHGVILPDEFIASATSGKTPQKPSTENVALDFWVDWASRRRLPTTHERLARALADARSAEAATIERLVNELRQKESPGTTPCIFAGCQELAPAGKAICARHAIDESVIRNSTYHLYALPPDLSR